MLQRLRGFLPVVLAGSLAWFVTAAPRLEGATSWRMLLGLLPPLLLLGGACASDRRVSNWLAIHGFVGASALFLVVTPAVGGGASSRALSVLAWATYALVWGAPLARELPLLEDVGGGAPLTPRRRAPWFAYIGPLLGLVLGAALVVPWFATGELEPRAELRLFLQLAGLAGALVVMARGAQWGAALHFDAPLTPSSRLRRAALALLVLTLALGAGVAATLR